MDYAEYCCAILKAKCEGLDSIYEDYIVRLIGEAGLTELRSGGYLEPCGVINGRQLYVIA